LKASSTMGSKKKDLLDKAIIEGLRAGDIQVLQILFDTYYSRLYQYAIIFVDREMARDFIHDLFYNLWVNRKTLDIQSSLFAYMCTTLRHRCYRYWKREKSRQIFIDDPLPDLKLEELHYLEKSQNSLLQFDLEDRVDQTLLRLPEKCRIVFELSRFEGLKNREIADRLTISIKTVEKHISKALHAFKEELTEYLVEED